MEDLACSICLIMDVKMYNLRSSPLDMRFECLIGLNPHKYDLLTHVCAECAFLINKYYIFRDKCFRGINILQDLLKDKQKIIRNNIQSIDRDHHKLSSTINVGLPNQVFLFIYSSNHSTEPLTPNKTTQIKQETIYTDYERNSYSDDDITSVKVEEDFELYLQQQTNIINEVKNEDCKEQENNSEKCELVNETPRPRAKRVSTTKLDEKNEKCVDKKIYELEDDNKKTINKAESGRIEKTLTKIINKPRRPKNKSGPNTKRGQIAKSLDKEICEYFTVISKSLDEQKADICAREQSVLYQNAAFKCTICFKVFVCQTTYQLHWKKHDPSAGPAECEVCRIRFPSGGLLRRHSETHARKYLCKFCDLVLYNRSNALFHRMWHLGIKFECEHCSQTFGHRTTYLSHVRIKHPSQHICNLCGYSFVSERGLHAHKVGMHDAITDSSLTGPSCDKCGIQFGNQKAFDIHMVNSTNHVDETSFQSRCEVCEMSFKDQNALKSHHRWAKCAPRYRGGVRNNDKCETQWPKKCDHCSEMMPSARQNWFHHRKEHRDKQYALAPLKPYICEVCGYRSSTQWHLTNHTRDNHSTDRPYACPHCPKTFGTPYKHKVHVRTHSLEKPFTCSVCPCAFKIKGDLLKHEKTHSGIRPYSCNICGKTFGSSTVRNSHVKYVHLKAPPPVRNRKPAKRKRKEELLG